MALADGAVRTLNGQLVISVATVKGTGSHYAAWLQQPLAFSRAGCYN